VVAEALALEWKGRRGWGYSHACPNTQVRGAGMGGGVGIGVGMERGRGWGYGPVCQNTECGWLLRHWHWRWHGKGGEGGDMVVHV